MDNANPLDLCGGEGFNVLFLVPNEAQSAYPTAIGAGEMFPVRREPPPRGLVLDAPVIVLKLGAALLAWFMRATVVIEALDSAPGTVCRCLTSLGIETGRKGIRFGEHGTVALQVILADARLIHPEAQALVADELHYANGFLNSGVLFLGAIQLIFVDQHTSCPSCFVLLS